jgi:EAL domain-containing protein (putative c-di-GMP-specific phosphodiesterase class I)
MVMKIACRQAQLWNQRYLPSHPLTLSVNLSSRHFTQPSLIKEITNILTETQFDPQHLRVEITETSMIKNIELTSDLIVQLKALNIGVYLDDFGTGYSCLSNLRHFPISAIKIDRSFIRSLDVDNENYQIVRAILILAHNLGMDVIAEGIELQNHMKHLQDLRCEYGQGYLFSRPIGSQEAELLIKKMPCW